jgi:predicted amidohydrolase YtcJ
MKNALFLQKNITMKKISLLFSLCLLLGINIAFAQKANIDVLIVGKKIYTIDNQFSSVEAVAIKDGKIVATGTAKKLQAAYSATKTLSLKKGFVYPGFIDAHAHFYGYGLGLNSVNLVGTKSWEECLARIDAFAKKNPDALWITGRGWDQNDWATKQYPTNKELNQKYADKPIYLSRIDGHAAICNTKALAAANIVAGQTLVGGAIEMQNGVLTGILIDNATDLVSEKIPTPTEKDVQNALQSAEKNCFAAGLTSVSDCGLDFPTVEAIERLHAANQLKMRMYVMLSDATKNFDFFNRRGIISTEKLTVRAFKFYGDGALGSRGACLQHDYNDRAGWHGFMLKNPTYFDSLAILMKEKGLQMCTHAIGDSANMAILRSYAKVLGGKNDLRWRIEHAQVIDSQDFNYFGKYNIVPSVQPTHATSDMYWAEKRLGGKRLKSAYAYQQLLKENDWIPLGTDFPVEDIDPIKTFTAAVFRQDAQLFPKGGFQIENALTREQTLRGMTIWAAKAQFEEKEKGSLEVGKVADLVVLDTDLMNATFAKIQRLKVLYTIVNGEIVFQKN